MADKAKDEIPDVYMMNDLEQVKVLADSLRVSILEHMTDEARTTKQVAQILGEKPTRLYHHVEALEKVGLIRLADTRPVRGTVEKYYRAVAKQFRAEATLFDPDTVDPESVVSVVETIFGSTGDDLRKLVAAGYDMTSTDESILSYVEFRGSQRDLDDLKAKLLGVLREFEKCCDKPEFEDYERKYRLTLAFFPLDIAERKRKPS